MNADLQSHAVSQHISKLQARLNNALVNLHYVFSLSDHNCQVYSSQSELTSPVLLTSFIQVANEEVKLEFASYDLLRLHPTVQNSANYENLPYILQLALLEYNLANLLNLLANIFDTPMSFLEKSKKDEEALIKFQLTMKIDLDGEVLIPITVYLSSVTLIESLILKLESQSFAKTTNLDFEIPISFEAGSMMLAFREIKDLEIGDVLLPKDYLPVHDKLLVRLTKNDKNIDYALLCKIENNQAIVLEHYKSCGENMSENNDTVQLNELELELSFELDRKLISLKELQAIDKDYIFELKSDALAPVNIRIMDKIFAQGKIVDIDGTIGVQLTNILMK